MNKTKITNIMIIINIINMVYELGKYNIVHSNMMFANMIYSISDVITNLVHVGVVSAIVGVSLYYLFK